MRNRAACSRGKKSLPRLTPLDRWHLLPKDATDAVIRRSGLERPIYVFNRDFEDGAGPLKFAYYGRTGTELGADGEPIYVPMRGKPSLKVPNGKRHAKATSGLPVATVRANAGRRSGTRRRAAGKYAHVVATIAAMQAKGVLPVPIDIVAALAAKGLRVTPAYVRIVLARKRG